MNLSSLRTFFVFGLLILQFQLLGQELKEQLQALSKTHDFKFETMEVDSFFLEKYVIYYQQPLDHSKPNGEVFTQRIFLSHRSFQDDVIFITEGYDANYAASPTYKNELTTLLSTNQICVEHRYFGTSIPEPLDWGQLTVYNAASDHHRIVDLLKSLYKGNWINTGISKGGQTTIYHRYFYPDDVDLSVGYVCPLNFSSEDKRVYRFLSRVGDSNCRNMVKQFQIDLLEHQDQYLPIFDSLVQARNLKYRMGREQAYELTVLEFSFAFWQWSGDCTMIPEQSATATKKLLYLDGIAGIDWISETGIQRFQAFFYQAMREIGFYGYDISEFSDWVSFDRNPNFEFTLPEGESVSFEPELMKKVDFFVRHEADKMIYIYGEYDPWSATAVEPTYEKRALKVVKSGGNHRTRINNLPKAQKQELLETIHSWLD